MAAKGWHLLGCCVLVLVGTGLAGIIVYGCRQSELQHIAESKRHKDQLRHKLFLEVKNGQSWQWVLDTELLSMHADDAECAGHITFLWFAMSDLADSEFRQTQRFSKLQDVAFYDCRNTDVVLESIEGMDTVETVFFAVSDITDDGIHLLSTLPNLRRVHFQQNLPPEKIDLLRRHLPHVELVYSPEDDGRQQTMHGATPFDGEP